MGVDAGTFAVQMDRLLDGLKAGMPKELFAGWVREYREQFGGLPWVTAVVLQRAVSLTLLDEGLIGKPLPMPAYFLGALRDAQKTVEREAQLRRPALTAVAPEPAEAGEERAVSQERAVAWKAWARARLEWGEVRNVVASQRRAAGQRAGLRGEELKAFVQAEVAAWEAEQPAPPEPVFDQQDGQAGELGEPGQDRVAQEVVA